MKFGKQMILAVVLMVTVFGASSASANLIEDMTRKLGRGVANVAFGPLEILIKPWDVKQENGEIAAITYGIFKGIACVIVREVVGVAEIITFPFPLPGCPNDQMDAGWGYGPMLPLTTWPEFVVDVEHNAFNMFFDDRAVIDTY